MHRYWLVTGSLLIAGAAQAGPLTFKQSVSYEEALQAAQVDHPVLQARELQVTARQATARAAAELPDPRLRAGILNLPISGPAAFELDRQLPSQISIGIEQEIPNLAKRRARSGIATTDVRFAQARLGLAERDIDVATGTAWIALHFAQQRLALAQSALAELRKFVPVANSAVAAGSARPAESLAIRRELLGIEDAITSIEADRETAQARLSRYVPVPALVADGAAPRPDVDPARLQLTLQTNPEILLADATSERAESSARLARAEKRPDFGVNVSYGRRGSDFGDVVSVLGSVTLPLFAGRRQEPRIAAAEAEAAASLAERTNRLREISAQFQSDVAAWRSAAEKWRRAREELLPLARDRAELETASFAAGRADLIDVIAAKSALALLELEILEREEATVAAAARLRLAYGENTP